MYIKTNGTEVIKFPYFAYEAKSEGLEGPLESHGIFEVEILPAPAYDSVSKIQKLGAPFFENGWKVHWELEELPEEEIEKNIEGYNSLQKSKRAKEYALETDSLFFKWQREEATKEDWEAAIQAVKDKYPYRENSI